MTTSERQKRYRAKRQEAGHQRLSVWLDAPTLTTLDRLAKRHGGRDKAITHVITQEGGTHADNADYES